MPFRIKTDHPLGWGDKEIRYLLTTGMNATNIYRAMGYKGNPTPSFKRRLERLQHEANLDTHN